MKFTSFHDKQVRSSDIFNKATFFKQVKSFDIFNIVFESLLRYLPFIKHEHDMITHLLIKMQLYQLQ